MNIDTIKVSYKRLEVIKKHKEELEKNLNVELSFEDNVVKIKGEPENVYFAVSVIKAIAKGFSKEQSFKLLNSENSLEIIDLSEFCNTENCIKRLKSRIIGTNGKIKKQIESSTDSLISVYGKSVSIIAPYYTLPYAKEAILRIIKGSKHSTILVYLKKAQQEIFYSKITGKEKPFY